MPSTRDIKRRIRSVKNTSQITKAMEVVSATKMRKSQEAALRGRPYAVTSLEKLKNLFLRTPDGHMPPLLLSREVRTTMVVVVTSDKGLAGAFNANVLKKAENMIGEYKVLRRPYMLVTIGKKAKEYFERRNETIHEAHIGYGDYATPAETHAFADMLIRGFLAETWDEVRAVYTNFRSTLVQQAKTETLLPATEASIEEAIRGILPEKGKYAEDETKYQIPNTKYQYKYLFEPSPAEILATLVPELMRIRIHHVILESNASEHSARMIAMKNASENAKELMETLGLAYNKARQSGITRELIEVTAGSEAMHN